MHGWFRMHGSAFPIIGCIHARMQVARWYATRALGRRRGSTAWCSCSSSRWRAAPSTSRRFSATTSAPATSPSNTAWAPPSPPPSSPASPRVAPAAAATSSASQGHRRRPSYPAAEWPPVRVRTCHKRTGYDDDDDDVRVRTHFISTMMIRIYSHGVYVYISTYASDNITTSQDYESRVCVCVYCGLWLVMVNYISLLYLMECIK